MEFQEQKLDIDFTLRTTRKVPPLPNDYVERFWYNGMKLKLLIIADILKTNSTHLRKRAKQEKMTVQELLNSGKPITTRWSK